MKNLMAGLQELTNYLRKEYSHENIRFWLATNVLRAGPASQILQRVQEIYEYESIFKFHFSFITYIIWYRTHSLTCGMYNLQWIPGSRGSVWDQHRRTYNGEGATGDEKSKPLHLRSSGRARLQLAPQEGLLSAIRPLRALQNTPGQRPSALSKETVSSSSFQT